MKTVSELFPVLVTTNFVAPAADPVYAIVNSLSEVLVIPISVPPVNVIASFVPSLPARFMFVVAAGTSTV